VNALENLVREFKAVGGGVTFNVGIFQEVVVGPKTVDRLAELAGRLGKPAIKITGRGGN